MSCRNSRVFSSTGGKRGSVTALGRDTLHRPAGSAASASQVLPGRLRLSARVLLCGLLVSGFSTRQPHECTRGDCSFFSKAFRWRASGFLSRGHPGCCSWWSQTPSDRGIGLLVTCGAANWGLQHPCTSPGLPTTPPCCLLDSQGLCPSTGTSHTPGTLTAAPLRTARLQPIPGASTGSHMETAAGFHGSLSKEITARCTCRYGAEYGAEPSFPCLPPPRSAEIPTHTSSRIQLHTLSHHAAQVIAFTFSLHSHRST